MELVRLRRGRGAGTVNCSETDAAGCWVAGRATSLTGRRDRCVRSLNARQVQAQRQKRHARLVQC